VPCPTQSETVRLRPNGPAPPTKQIVDRDRRAVRAVDLTDEDIAAIEASEMAHGFEHLNAEVDKR
jgi:hypothetical protein